MNRAKTKGILHHFRTYKVKCKCGNEFIILDGVECVCSNCGFSSSNHKKFVAYRSFSIIKIYVSGAVLTDYFDNRPWIYVD